MAPVGTNLVYEVLADLRLVVSCQSKDFATDAEWDAWLAACGSLQREDKPFQILSVTEGGHPTKSQIDRLRAANRTNPATALVSPSLGFRFLASALTFINPTIRCFSPADYDKAFDHVALAHPDRERVRRVVERLNRQLVDRSSAA